MLGVNKPVAPVEVFCSFADTDADRKLFEQLERHLSQLHRENYISTWHKHQITPGSEWQVETDRRLNTAQLILLLISSDFLASDYCYGTEMQRALQRQQTNEAIVVPILLRPCDWQGAPFASLQPLPTGKKTITQWKDRDEAWLDVVNGLRRLLEAKFGTGNSGTGHNREAQQPPVRNSDGAQTVKALFMAANPAMTSRLAIDEEMRAIEQKVRAAEHRDRLIFQSALAVRPDDLLHY